MQLLTIEHNKYMIGLNNEESKQVWTFIHGKGKLNLGRTCGSLAPVGTVGRITLFASNASLLIVEGLVVAPDAVVRRLLANNIQLFNLQIKSKKNFIYEEKF